MMTDMFDISGKVAVVTGGSRGIGKMIAAEFVRRGVRTYITARKAEACLETAEELSKEGECIALPGDLSTMEGLTAFADAIAEREDKLDILVNNAGAAWGAPFDEFPESGWDKVMDLNVKSLFFLTQKLAPLLRANASLEQPAKVINVASIDGIHNARIETYSYSASKAAVIHLTRRMAKRLVEDHIHVNAIAPGAFASNMNVWTRDNPDEVAERIPAKRVGTPDDMAGVAVYMSSKAGDYLVGITIAVDGGVAYAT
ncbi:MAG: SDR family NAD(P)-dependent oxidoreductase [Woeseiaceae bacterium]